MFAHELLICIQLTGSDMNNIFNNPHLDVQLICDVLRNSAFKMFILQLWRKRQSFTGVAVLVWNYATQMENIQERSG
jgi:predicted nicotinamide N-methyase